MQFIIQHLEWSVKQRIQSFSHYHVSLWQASEVWRNQNGEKLPQPNLQLCTKAFIFWLTHQVNYLNWHMISTLFLYFPMLIQSLSGTALLQFAECQYHCLQHQRVHQFVHSKNHTHTHLYIVDYHYRGLTIQSMRC